MKGKRYLVPIFYQMDRSSALIPINAYCGLRCEEGRKEMEDGGVGRGSR